MTALPPARKNVFFRALPELPLHPPSPNSGNLYHFFLDVKNGILACITEPSNDDYDNHGSDNCNYNLGTFDDFSVKMANKYT